MANVRVILDTVWSDLRQANVVDNLAIIEYIAALLIEGKPWPFDEKLRPQKPRVRYNPDDESLKNRLYQAVKEINPRNSDKGTAELFDQHVLFYSTKYLEKGNYPTPRYLVEFMLEILEIEKAHDLVDFTCGSGGFLVHRYAHELSSKSPKRGLTVGVDISPDWIRIAQANIFFHQLTGIEWKNIHLHTGDALRLIQQDQPLMDKTFNRIIISPPLYLPIKSAFVRDTVPKSDLDDPGRADSDTILAALLQKKLSASGKGTILVSESTLTHSSRTSQFLRQELVDKREIQALVEFDTDVLQPFTDEKPYLLVVCRKQQKWFWILRVERDGYASGRGRDLTQAPSLSLNQNDIPFMQIVAKVTGQERELQDQGGINGDLSISHWYIEQDNKTLGVVIKIHQQVKVTQIFYEPDDASNAHLRMYIENGQRQWHEDIHINSFRDELGDRRLIFKDGKPAQMIAVSFDGRILGITVPTNDVVANKYDIRPSTYFNLHLLDVKKGETTALAPWTSPGMIIATENESLIADPEESTEHSLDPNVAQIPPVLSYPPLLMPLPDDLYPFSKKQRAIWDCIKEYYSTDKYAAYFTESQLAADFAVSHQETDTSFADLLVTLDQCERLGLLIRAHVQFEEDDVPTLCYRRVLVSDISYINPTIREQLPEETKVALTESMSETTD